MLAEPREVFYLAALLQHHPAIDGHPDTPGPEHLRQHLLRKEMRPVWLLAGTDALYGVFAAGDISDSPLTLTLSHWGRGNQALPARRLVAQANVRCRPHGMKRRPFPFAGKVALTDFA